MHIKIEDSSEVWLHDFEIFVDHWSHKVSDRLMGYDYPTFPLGTSGIEMTARSALVEKLRITSFDDAIAIKSGNTDN